MEKFGGFVLMVWIVINHFRIENLGDRIADLEKLNPKE